MEEGETLHIRFKKCMPFPALNLKLKLSPISERHMLYRRRTNGTLKCRQFGFSVCFKKKNLLWSCRGFNRVCADSSSQCFPSTVWVGSRWQEVYQVKRYTVPLAIRHVILSPLKNLF